jgi:Tat protein translocase TatB subunit
MLGIGMQEILIILAVALIVIGPKRLPDLAKTLGKGFAEFRKAADDLQETVRMDLQREKHEEFKEKYPDLVPEEDDSVPSPAPDTSGPSPSTDEAAVKAPTDVAEPVKNGSEGKPSHNPDEINGGSETKDGTKDG